MGIPSYFRQIIKDYPETHFWKDDLDVDHFLIDFNAMIYHVIALLNKELGDELNKTSPVVYETKLLNGVIKQLQHVICDVIKPKQTVYIAVDGPPPRAKMVQQRSRRYKVIKEQNFRKDLEQKYHVKIPSLPWNRSAISPGTSFMSKTSKMIIRAIQQRTFQIHNEKLLVIFSDDSIPGEGEHKLLPSIRRLKDTNETSVIYSPDADLIVLSVMSGIPNIFILREPKDSDIEMKLYRDHEFLYLSIDVCRREFNRDLTGQMGFDKKNDLLYRQVLRDYSFLTFLCGNDFVLPAPFLKMKEGGIQILIDVYKEVWKTMNPELELSGEVTKGQFLVINKLEDKIGINSIFLLNVLKELGDLEEAKLKRWQRKRDKIRKGARNPKREAWEREHEQWEVEMSRFQHEEYYSPTHPFFDRFNRVFDRVNYFDENWNEQYNKHFFPEESIDDVCKLYIQSLEFCLKYYFEGTPSWTWFYPYRAAPTIKDFCNYIEKRMKDDHYLEIEFEKGSPCTPFEQLMMILPRVSFKLLPRSLNIDRGDELEEYYPRNFILDIVQGTKFIYSEPILPDIPLEKIRERIAKVEGKFSDLERNRNTLRTKPYIYKPRNRKPRNNNQRR